jgi:hypothetical protein
VTCAWGWIYCIAYPVKATIQKENLLWACVMAVVCILIVLAYDTL